MDWNVCRSIGTDGEHSGDLKQSNNEDKYGFVPENLVSRTSFNSANSDESSDEENEPSSTFVDKDEIWDPPDPENNEVDEDNNISSIYDYSDECADVDVKEWGKQSSLNGFEGLSSSYRYNEEKQKALNEVRDGKFKNLVSQLIKKAVVDNCSEEGESWVDIVTQLVWQAALFVNPDATAGKKIDPSDCVKVKCIASGSRSTSQLIKGLVFKKHAAHKHMATKHKNPRLLLIEGTLGSSSSGLASFSSMLPVSSDQPDLSSFSRRTTQGKDNITDLIKTLVKDCHPNVILVEKSASRDVLNEILKMGVTLVLDMKLESLKEVSQCTGSPIFSSDNILNQELKHCDSLYFEKFVEQHAFVGNGEKMPCKTLMFLEGCPTRLRCTILLKGSQSEELKKIKCVVQCAVVMAYNFILETSFLVDQKAMFSTIVDFASTDGVHVSVSNSSDEESSHAHESTLRTATSCVLDIPISNGMNGREAEAQTAASVPVLPIEEAPDGLDVKTKGNYKEDARKEVDDGEKGIQLQIYFSRVLDSESILVLMSNRNASRGTLCEQSQSHIKLYKKFDTLGKFLRDNLFNQSLQCKACGGLPQAHFYYYAHHNKQLMIRVKRLDKALPREREGKLWMWSRCGKCEPDKEKATKRVLVLTAACGLSLGKFMELSLSRNCSYNRLSSCGHSFQKDFLYFFGLGSMVALFHCSPVALYTISVPAQKLEFNSSSNRDWLQQEMESVYTEGILLFTEVGKYLEKMETRFSGLNLVLDGSSKAFADVVDMLKLERSEFEKNIKNISIKNDSLHHSVHKVLSLNRLRWEILLEACVWDKRLQLLLSSSSTLVCSLPLKNSEDSRGWVWNPFAQIREESKKDLHQGYLPKFGHLPKFELLRSPDFSRKVSQLVIDEGLRLHIPVSNGDYIVSDYDGEISSSAACALALMKDLNPSASDSSENITLQHTTSERSSWSLDSPNAPDSFHPAPSLPSLDSHLSRFDGSNQLDFLVSYGQLHHEVTLGIRKCPSKGKYSVLIMYASEFHGLRSRCYPSELDYIASLSRCKVWDAKGGKNKSVSSKTLDDRLIIKEMKKTELESFLKFAPDYFRHMNISFDYRNQTCLAKILGIYQVTIRDVKSSKSRTHVLMIQENLCFGSNITRQYDLKGALHARFTATTDGTGDVLLDQNFVSDMISSPLYISKKLKTLLERAIWNDTTFLNSLNVTGYSLFVGVDREQRKLVCGIIDYLSTYTTVMEFETWVKTFFVLPMNALPTIIAPKDYKNRFRKFMTKHFLAVPDCSKKPSNPCKVCGIKAVDEFSI